MRDNPSMKNENDIKTAPNRKKHKKLSILIIVLLAAATAGACIWCYPIYKAYRQGQADAQKQWQNGEPEIMYIAGINEIFTYIPGNDIYYLDSKTGLPMEIIPPCQATLKLKIFIAGHNNTIKKLIAKNGPPTNSYKIWINQISNPAKYFTKNPIKSTQLTLNGPRQKFGKGSIKLIKNSIPGQPAKLDVTINGKLYLITLELLKDYLGQNPDSINILLGPTKSTLVFIRVTNSVDGKFSYWIFDAKTGKSLYVK